MDSNLEMTPDPHVVQFPVRLEPPIQPLDGDSTVVDHLPFGGFVGLGDQFIVTRIRVDDGSRAALPSDYRAHLLA